MSLVFIALVTPPKRIPEIAMKELIKNKGKYQGKLVKTRGCFLERFEERALYYNCTIERNTKETIWIVFSSNAKRKFNFDSLSSRQIIIQGTLDTTKKGHCSAYPCSLFNADIIEIK